MTLKRYVILIVAVVSTAQIFAQLRQKLDPDSIIAKFECRFAMLDSLIFNVNGSNHKTQSYSFNAASQKFGDTLIADSLYDEALKKSVDAQARFIKSATGLQVSGSTYYRLDNEFGFDEDDAVSRYDAKVQAELRWNILKSGLYNRSGRIQEAEIQADIDRLSYAKETRGTEYARQREFYRTYQDSALCAVLTHRVANLKLLSNAYLYLLGNENISSDNLMNILSETSEAERKLAALTVCDVFSRDLSMPDAFLVRLDTTAFLKYVEMNQADFKIAQRKRDLLEQRAKNESYWNDVDVSPFVRYSFYMRPYADNSSNVDAGIYFKLPISGESAKKRKALIAQGEAISAEQFLRMRQIADEVRSISIEVERLNRSIEGEYRRSLELKNFIATRTNAYSNRRGEYDRLARMKEYNAYLLCLERLLEFRYSRDAQIASLAKFLAGETVSDFCSVEFLSDQKQ